MLLISLETFVVVVIATFVVGVHLFHFCEKTEKMNTSGQGNTYLIQFDEVSVE